MHQRNSLSADQQLGNRWATAQPASNSVPATGRWASLINKQLRFPVPPQTVRAGRSLTVSGRAIYDFARASTARPQRGAHQCSPGAGALTGSRYVTGCASDHSSATRSHRTVTASDPPHFEQRWDVVRQARRAIPQFALYANVCTSLVPPPLPGGADSRQLVRSHFTTASRGDQWGLGIDFIKRSGSSHQPYCIAIRGTSR